MSQEGIDSLMPGSAFLIHALKTSSVSHIQTIVVVFDVVAVTIIDTPVFSFSLLIWTYISGYVV